MPAVDEQRLIRQAQAGNPYAFEELVRRHQRAAYNLAYRLTGSHADAADALQDTFIRVYRKLPTYEGRAAFSTWLYRVVTNTCLDQMRQRRNCTSLELVRESPLMQGLPAEEGDPGPAAERSELAAALRQALEALPREYRTAIILRDLYGCSLAEMEQALGCGKAALKSRLHRGRRKLRRLLQDAPAFRLAAGQ